MNNEGLLCGLVSGNVVYNQDEMMGGLSYHNGAVKLAYRFNLDVLNP